MFTIIYSVAILAHEDTKNANMHQLLGKKLQVRFVIHLLSTEQALFLSQSS
ncbi:MAG: hypothetical protein H6Q13_533 [Bacteroidetes bacterium]|jgi:hypothetical protein|nr:hypothetical protein [Bacteroidota bacterium]